MVKTRKYPKDKGLGQGLRAVQLENTQRDW